MHYGRRHAVTLRNTAFVLEPTTTKELQRAIGAADAGGRLETKLVKDVLSITRELMYESCGQPHLKSLQEVSQQRMADVISYTIVFERAQYSTATESLQRALEEKYVLLACHNFWPKGNTHHGIKSSFYVGHGLMPFEVQIHTPEVSRPVKLARCNTTGLRPLTIVLVSRRSFDAFCRASPRTKVPPHATKFGSWTTMHITYT